MDTDVIETVCTPALDLLSMGGETIMAVVSSVVEEIGITVALSWPNLMMTSLTSVSTGTFLAVTRNLLPPNWLPTDCSSRSSLSTMYGLYAR